MFFKTNPRPSGVEADFPVLPVQDETVRVSPRGEDGRGVREALGHSVL